MMSLFMGLCTIIGACFLLSFLFKVFGKVICWVIGGIAAVAGVVVLGSFVLVGVYFLALLAFFVFSLFAVF